MDNLATRAKKFAVAAHGDQIDPTPKNRTQNTNDAACGQIKVNLDRQNLPVEVIHDIKGTKSSPTDQRIVHEVC